MEIKKTFSIKGMHCASCVSALEKSLKGVEGVSKANVNLATEKATVEYDPNKVTDKELSSAVSNVGYQALINEELQSEVQEKARKQKELSALKNKVMLSLVFGGLVLWGSFPGLARRRPRRSRGV